MSRCNCKRPPGGGTDCPENSLAICRRENGECKGYCRTLPDGLNRLEMDNWILRIVKEDDRSLSDSLSYEDRTILDNREYAATLPSGVQVVIRFDYPDTDEINGPQIVSAVKV